MKKNQLFIVALLAFNVSLNSTCSADRTAIRPSRVEPTNELQRVRFSVDPLSQTRSYGVFVSARLELVVFDSADLSISQRIAVTEDYEFVTALGGSDGFVLVNDGSIAFAGGPSTIKLEHELESVDVIYPSFQTPAVIVKDRSGSSLSYFKLSDGQIYSNSINTGESDVFVAWTGDSDELAVISANGGGYFYGSAEQLFSSGGQWPPCELSEAGFNAAEGEAITSIGRLGDGSFALGTSLGRVSILRPQKASCGGASSDALNLGQNIVSISASGEQLFIRSGESSLNAGKMVDDEFYGNWSAKIASDSIAPIFIRDGLLMVVTSGFKEVDVDSGAVISEEPTSIILFDNAGTEINRFQLSSEEATRIEGVVLDIESRKLFLVENSSAGSLKVFDLETGTVQVQQGRQLEGVLKRL